MKNFYVIAIIFFHLNIYCEASSQSAITIITSLYNGDQYIKGFLEDITRQSIFDQCELIIINANSPGNEEPIIKEYLTQYSNIEYIHLENDPGLYGVWNLAIALAHGEFITNANVDDRLHPKCYEFYLNELSSNPDIDLIYSDYYITKKANETFEAHSGKRSRLPKFSKSAMISCLPGCHPMWRKSMHTKYGYFNEKYKSAGDWEMWLRATRANAQFKKIEHILSLMYVNPTCLSQNIKHAAEVTEIYLNYQDLFAPLGKTIEKTWTYKFVSNYLSNQTSDTIII